MLSSKHPLNSPNPEQAVLILPYCKPTGATCDKAKPGLPTMLADGTSTSLKVSCARPADRNPIKSWMGPISRPGVSLGTRQATEPCSSFPNTRNTPASCAQLIHFLLPFRIRESLLELRVNSVTRD